MTRARVTLAIAFGALALTACGGGNDGGSNNCDPTAPGCTTNGNTAPTAKANGPYSSVVGGSVSFSAAGSFDKDKDDLPQTLKYDWDFGDGTVGSGAQATHTYTTARSYTASLKVTDSKGATGNDTAPVTISAVTAPPAGSQTGTLSIVLTDAPFPFDSVASANMYVVRVDARFNEPTTAAELNAAADGNPTTGWVTVATPQTSLIDLLTLQGGVTKQLGAKTDMPVGSYRGFRIVLDVAQSNLTLRSGSKPAIAWGVTGQIAYYKITPAATVTLAANGVANVLVDFDLGRSFAMLGASPSAAAGFQGAPSLRTIASGQNGIVLGRVVLDDGTVVGGASIELLPAGTDGGDMDRNKILATTGTNAQGGFQISNVTPGAYALRITLPPAIRPNATQTFGVTASAPGQALTTSRSFEFELLR